MAEPIASNRQPRVAFRLLAATAGLLAAGLPAAGSARTLDAENSRKAVDFESAIAATQKPLALYDRLRGVSRREFVARAGIGGHGAMAGQSFDRVEAYGSEVAAIARQGTDATTPGMMRDLDRKAGGLLSLVDKMGGDYLKTDWLAKRKPARQHPADALVRVAITSIGDSDSNGILSSSDPSTPPRIRADELQHVKSAMIGALVDMMHVRPNDRASAVTAIWGDMDTFMGAARNEESLARSVFRLGTANVPAEPSARLLSGFRQQVPVAILHAAKRLESLEYDVKFDRPPTSKAAVHGPA